MKSVKCKHCNKLLFKVENFKGLIEIKCNKCKNIIEFKQ